MKAKTTFVAVCASIALTSTAMAHPAHPGVAGDGLASGFLHPWLGMDHLLAMVAVGLLAVQIGGRALWLLPAAFIGSMVLGGTLGIAGWNNPFVEFGIAFSVLALGLALAVGRKYPLAASAMAIGLFGLFHGHAHGTEMPTAAAAAVYFLGFVAGTSFLHLLGIGAGLYATNNRTLTPALRWSGAGVACVGMLLLLGIV